VRKHCLIYSTTGFTLVELTIVLFVVALLLGGMMSTLSAQVGQQKIQETQRLLDEARDALTGYAATNGRLPCPASPLSNGVESFCTNASGICVSTTVTPQAHGNCSNFYNGMLPSVTLSLAGVDSNGYLTDGWGLSSNRVRYAVHSSTINGISNPFTVTDGAKTATMPSIASFLASSPLLSVCSTATGIINPGANTAKCPAASTLTNSAVAVIFSLGKNAPTGGTGADEAANINNDPVFVSHTPTPASSGNEFDDLVTWLSPNILFNRMIAAGRLP
jgi:type II secretory pathway pseudopilin PulG